MPHQDSKRMTVSRRGFVAAAAAMGTAGIALAAQQESAKAAADGKFRLLCAPVLTNPAPDAVTVLWATSDMATGWVEYGETESLGQVARGMDQGLMPYERRYMKIRVGGLKPGTRYYYRVCSEHTTYDWHQGIARDHDGAARSELASFVTPNPNAAETTFTVWNDTHENVETLKAVHAAHQQSPGDFMLWNGDISNDLYDEPKIVDQFLNPAGLPFAANVPFYFVRGNHDARGPFARLLNRVTDVPDGQFYYTFRHGPMAAIVLDTGEDKPDDHPVYADMGDFAAFRSLQTEWLAEAITRPEFRDAPFRVLFCHIPLWWTNDEHTGTYCLDGQRKWHQLLVDAGVQLVISGHTHQATHLPADNRHPYIQLTGGGPRPDTATYMRGHATADQLTIMHHKLDGSVVHEIRVNAS